MPESLKLIKLSYKLHKSINKYDNVQDFSLALNMFPNKLRFESVSDRLEFLGERKIVSLIKEKVIFEVSTHHYKNLKKVVKS